MVLIVLIIAFTAAFIIRCYPLKYGFYLEEFDPYFNYRATKFIVDYGLDEYWSWHDTMSWYPNGRDIAKTSQAALHITAAFLYNFLSSRVSLLDFTIIFPVVIGSLTTIVVFALTRVVGGTTAGLFAALLFAVSPIIIQRGTLGWFKSEPLGLFFGLLSIYLFLSAIKHKEAKYAIPKSVIAGILAGLGNASWGGNQYFTLSISLFLIAIPFFRKETKIPLLVAVIFTIFVFITTSAFPRPGVSFIFGIGGIALVTGTAFLTNAHFLKALTKPKKYFRYTSLLLIGFLTIGVVFISSSLYYPSGLRYIAAINPFVLSEYSTILKTVAEHYTPTLVDYFTNYSLVIMFAGFGILTAFRRLNEMSVFVLIFALIGIYSSASIGRLLILASAGTIILAAIGLSSITKNIMNSKKNLETLNESASDHKTFRFFNPRTLKRLGLKSVSLKSVYAIMMIFILAFPLVYPPNNNWISMADISPSILNGGTGYKIKIDDWINALNWISDNTAKDSVIVSWWDYGYWITTIANRTTLIDNANINQGRIATISKMFLSPEQDGIQIAKDLHVDYILIFIVAQRVNHSGHYYYLLGNGGDESKLQSFIHIGGFTQSNFLESDYYTPKPSFWNGTLLGKLIPFIPKGYAIYNNVEEQQRQTSILHEYVPYAYALYSKQLKYPMQSKGEDNLSLVYSSNSFRNAQQEFISTVLIYKINS